LTRSGIAERVLEETIAGSVGGLAPSNSGGEGLFTWKVALEEKPLGLVRGSVEVEWSERGERTSFSLSKLYSLGR